MKTNVTIRIDEEIVQNAKELDLNISRISEKALLQAVKEETKPYMIVETSQIILDAKLYYNIRERALAVTFIVFNASEENVISDRINYSLLVTDRETFTDLPIRQSIQEFKGINLERKTVFKGQREIFVEHLSPSPELSKIFSEVTHEDTKNLRWVIYPTAFVESKKRVLQAKFEQILDEKKHYLLPRPIEAF
jgi:hypothetical protein